MSNSIVHLPEVDVHIDEVGQPDPTGQLKAALPNGETFDHGLVLDGGWRWALVVCASDGQVEVAGEPARDRDQ